MTGREKVIQHFTDCCDIAEGKHNYWVFVRADVLHDAIALLKAQEPVMEDVYPEPLYLCKGCDAVILKTDKYRANFCHRCGMAVKWE